MNKNLLSLISLQTQGVVNGEVSIPGDKSISHRALILSALATGKSKIVGLLEGEDVLCTAAALRKMGVEINKDDGKTWLVNGVGISGLKEPDDILDVGNSGTSARLLSGLVSSFNFTTFFTGDVSLRKRPMKRVFEPLQQFGVQVVSRISDKGDYLLPAVVIGAKNPKPITYKMKNASAQVKSAILLAAINVKGTTTVIESERSRDHTEIMMNYLGIKVSSENSDDAGKLVNRITISGGSEFLAKDFYIPGDISSAAFIIVAALIVPGSKVRINNVGVNPLRDGIIKTLQEMGGSIELHNQRIVGGEKVADILVKYSLLKGVSVPSCRAPKMIDEYPILAIAAANAVGITKMNGLEELKVKESNRLNAIYEGLKTCGVEVKIGTDYLEIKGGIVEKGQPAKIKTNMDHRIAMAFLIMGLVIKNGVEIDDALIIRTSFPNFMEIFANFGINFQEVN